MEEEAAVILSAIEKLDSWLQLKKADLRDDDKKKLSSLTLMLEKSPDPCSAVVGMAELWEHNREKLYSLLVMVADPRNGTIEEADKVREIVYSLLVEITDLWEDDGNKEKLHSLLFEIANPRVVFNDKFASLVVEMVGLWEVSKGKLNKEKLNSWLANKADHLMNHNKEKLFRLLHKEMGYLYHPQILGEMEGAKNDLRDILGLLDRVKNYYYYYYFISDVVEMAHDAQFFVHVLDSDPFILLLQIFRCFKKEHIRLHPLDKFLFGEITYIWEGLRETKTRMLELEDESVVGITPTSTPAPTNSDVVGLEEDVELLLGMKNGIISIKGMSGIGKTTLARELYNHPKMVDGFECRAWVCLSSRELSRKEILIKLIHQLQADDVDNHMLTEKMDNKSLRQMLHQHLQGRPYFIVLDHVSSDIYFKYVTQALPQDKRSRLLFTTRIPDLRCNKYFDECEHKMKNLNEDKSWQLLLKTALCDGEFPKQLEKKGRQMLMRTCGGLPLAIEEVGRQWAEKRRSGSEWEQVIVECAMHLDLNETLAALESTYLNFYQEQKSCFLRLALFKEGNVIRENKLLQIWNAEVLSELQCEIVLSELTEESVMEVEYVTDPCKEKTYRINAVFHRLSITKAVDEIGFEILGNENHGTNINRASHEPRHRVINCSRDDKFNYNYSSTNQDEHLVSLFFRGGGGHSHVCHPSYWNHFKQLKILDIEGFGLKILAETVGELTKLIYLGLRNNYIQELPHSVSRLKKLEVLDIAQNFMVEVADFIWEMDSLRHLYMSDISCQKPLKIDALKKLKTLTYISVDNWTYEVSDLKNMMTSLRRLGIEEVDGNTDVSTLLSSLAKLDNLDCLILRGFRFRSMPSLDELGLLLNLTELKLEGKLTRLPSANNFPPKLSNLVLVNSCLDEDPMPILEKLQKLECLKLQNAYTGQQMVISPLGLFSLGYLFIGELWHLRNLQVGKRALVFLYQLEISSCPYLDTLPEEIISNHRLGTLKMVTTKNIATKIQDSYFVSKVDIVDMQP